MNLTESLISWYDLNKRPLPWRETTDPYKIWISEVILQQTRVAHGMEYYHRFLVAFPDVQSLSSSDEQEVLKLWQGLGYYSRARNMHHTAKDIVSNHSGKFPDSALELRKLKGIGPYTAAAIASICFNEPVAVLDGNVARIMSRIFALEVPSNSVKGQKELQQLADGIIDKNRPAQFNQATMELGATVCTPKNPLCGTCPVSYFCEARKRNQIELFPIKISTKIPALRYLNYLVIRFKDSSEKFVLMRKRTGNEIWKNMYDFPCIETEQAADTPALLEQFEKQGFTGGFPYIIKHVSVEYKHQLSHRTLMTRFIRIDLLGIPPRMENMLTLSENQLEHYPLPRLIDRYLENTPLWE